jgi:hypothetical protein
VGAATRAVLVAMGLAWFAPSARADDSADLAALPVLAELRTGATPVVVRGDLDPRQARDALREVRGVYDDVARRFVAAASGRPPVTLCLFATEAAYTRFVTRVFGPGMSPLGFYRADRRIAVANLARGVGNARHELVHPLLGDDFAAIPPWLNEGIAALYGSARITGGRVDFRVNYRLRDLQAAMRRGRVPSLDELAGLRADGFYGPAVATHYALARYLLLYLHRRGELAALYRELRAAAGDVDRQRALVRARVDERAFAAWARRLRWLQGRSED